MKPKIKTLILFIIATSSLLMAGALLNTTQSLMGIVAIQWFGLSGTVIVYKLGYNFLTLKAFKFLINNFFDNKLTAFFLIQFIIIAIPMCIFVLSAFSIYMFALIFFFGLFYSIKLRFRDKKYIMKDIFFIKNILIGFNWGALILIGAGTVSSSIVQAVFIFTSLQIVIGSMIRDVFDVKKDKGIGIKTVPIIIGINSTLNILLFANILTFGMGYLINQTKPFLILMILVIIWKALIIEKVRKNNDSIIWSQTNNILLCFLIFAILFIQHLDELY